MGHGDHRMILVNINTLVSYLLNIPLWWRSEIKGQSNWYPDKNMFYLINRMDGTLHLFDISNKSERSYLIHDYSIWEASWSSGKKKIALVIRDKKSRHFSIRIFNNPVKD
jgi:WD40 repeat protein